MELCCLGHVFTALQLLCNLLRFAIFSCISHRSLCKMISCIYGCNKTQGNKIHHITSLFCKSHTMRFSFKTFINILYLMLYCISKFTRYSSRNHFSMELKTIVRFPQSEMVNIWWLLIDLHCKALRSLQQTPKQHLMDFPATLLLVEGLLVDEISIPPTCVHGGSQ